MNQYKRKSLKKYIKHPNIYYKKNPKIPRKSSIKYNIKKTQKSNKQEKNSIPQITPNNNPFNSYKRFLPESLPLLDNDDDIECGICFEDNCDYKTNCNHLFHKNCISKWLNTCPICENIF